MANNRKVVFYDETNFSHSGEGDTLINHEQTLNPNGIYFTPTEITEYHHIGHAGNIYTLGSKVIDINDLDKTVFIISDDPNNYMSGNDISVITDIKSNVFKKTLEVHHAKLDFGVLIEAINKLYKDVNDQVSLVKFYAHIPGEESARLIDVVAVKNKTLLPSDLPGTGAVNMYLPSGSTKTFDGNWSKTDGGSQINIPDSGINVDGTLKLYAVFVNANLGQHTITGFSPKSCTYGTESLLVNAGSCSTGQIKYRVISPVTNAEVTGLKADNNGVPYNRYVNGDFLDAYDNYGNQIRYTVEAKVEETVNYNAKTISVEVTIDKASSTITYTTSSSSSSPIGLTIDEEKQLTLTLNNCTLGNIATPTGVTVRKVTSNTIYITASQSMSGYITVSGYGINANYNNPSDVKIYIKAVKTNTSISGVSNNTTINLAPNNNKQYTLTVSGDDNMSLSASSNNTSVATATITSKTLTIKAIKDGTATITISGTVSNSNKYNAPQSITIIVNVVTAIDYGYYKEADTVAGLYGTTGWIKLISSPQEITWSKAKYIAIASPTNSPKYEMFSQIGKKYVTGKLFEGTESGINNVTIDGKEYHYWETSERTSAENMPKIRITTI